MDLRALAKTAIAELAAIADARDLDLGLLPGDATIAGDPAERRTLLGNLVDNAPSTPSGGWVDVGIQHGPHEIVLSVRDTGPGHSAEERSRVFDRFYPQRQASAPGSGLGLAIVSQHRRPASRPHELSAPEDGPGFAELRCTSAPS